MLKDNLKILISGGGTGGHVNAGIAIADEWKIQKGEKAKVIFVGAHGGIEEKLVPRSNYPLLLLSIGALNRVGFSRRIKTVFQLPLSCLKAFFILASERPGVVIGVGGYASGPVLLVASLFKIFFGWETAILEQNSVPGLTNRILGRLVDHVFTAFNGMDRFFSAPKIKCTGNPIRSTISRYARAPRNPFVIFAFGGSQGAAGMNTLILSALPYLKQTRIEWIHQTGEIDYERVRQGYQSCGIQARVEKFIFDMPSCYSQASLVICRAGSSTMAEIAAAGRAAIFVPLPTASDNHQVINARQFVDQGAALLVEQGQIGGEEFAKIILGLMKESKSLDEMEEKVVQFYKPHGAQDVVKALASGRTT